jgi:hypothetical protein
MSIDNQIDILQNNMINYFNYKKLLTYVALIIIKKVIFGLYFIISFFL